MRCAPSTAQFGGRHVPAAFFVLASLLAAVPAHASGSAAQVVSESIAPPATELLTTNGTSPTAARTFYSNDVTHTNGLSTGASIPEEIATLAESLRADRNVSLAADRDAFAADVLAYVRNTIKTEMRYGLAKGALGALIDQSGSPFDQAELMVMLLESEGVDATFVSGDVVMTAAQFGKWSGLVNDLNESTQAFTVNAAAACKLLADGGIPVIVNGTSNCDGLSGNMTSATLAHVWVRVAGLDYDPSFKEHALRNGIDLPAAMGCGTAAASTCGTSTVNGGMAGATQGTMSGIPYLQGYSGAGAAAALDAMTLNLANHIKTGNIAGQGINASVLDVLGGRKLEAQTLSRAPLQYVEYASWTGRIPNKYRTILTVHVGAACASFFTDEIAGRSLLYKRNTQSTAGFFVNGVAVSSLSYTPAKSCSGTVPRIRLSVDHPYAGTSGGYADDAVDFKPVDPTSDETGFIRRARAADLYNEGGAGAEPRQYVPASGGGSEPQQLATDWPEQNYLSLGTVTIIHEFGQSGPSGQKYMSDYDAVASQTNERCGVTTTTKLAFRQCDYEQHAVVAKGFNTVRTMADELVDGVNKSVSVRHHDIGIVYNGRGSGVALMSVQESISITPRNNSASARNAAFDQASLILAEAESRANAIDSAPGISAARAFFRAGTQRIFDITPANMAAYVAYLPKQAQQVVGGQTRFGNYCIKYLGYSGNSLGPDGCWRHVALQDVANQGYSTLIAEGGLGELFYKGSSERAFTMWEYVKGGVTIGDGYSAAMKTTELTDANALRREFLNVSPSSGDLRFTAGADIVTGAGEFPYSLPFVRTFTQRPYEGSRFTENSYYGFSHGGLMFKNSSSAITAGPDSLDHDRLGGGWVHNYQVRLQRSNDLTYQLGSQNAYLASEIIAALQVIKDLGLGGTLPQKVTSIYAINNLSRTIAGYLGGTWNTLIVRKGDRTTAFYEAPDGSWFAPSEIGAKVTTSGSGHTYTSSNGETITFSPYRYDAAFLYTSSDTLVGPPTSYTEYKLFKADTWTFPDGVTLTFTYQGRAFSDFTGCPTQLQPPQYLGNYGYLLTRVENNLGRRLDFAYATTQIARQSTDLGCEQDPGSMILWAPTSPGMGTNYSLLLNRVTDENGRYVQFNAGGQINASTFTLTDTMNGQTRYEYNTGPDSPAAAAVLRDGYQLRRWFTPAMPTTAYQSIRYDSFGRVDRVTDANNVQDRYFPSGIFGSESWKQSRLVNGAGNVTIEQFNDRNGNIRTIDGRGQITARLFDNAGRVTRVVMPEGNATETSYDFRGNPVKVCQIGKNRAGQPCSDSLDLEQRTTYAEGPTVLACVNPIICNKPIAEIDAKNNTTDYLWWPTTGNLRQVLRPAASAGSTRPQIDLAYTTYNGISFLTQKTEKITASASTVTSYTYDSANHYALRTMVQTADATSLTTCLQFDAVGNLVATTQPLGTAGGCP